MYIFYPPHVLDEDVEPLPLPFVGFIIGAVLHLNICLDGLLHTDWELIPLNNCKSAFPVESIIYAHNAPMPPPNTMDKNNNIILEQLFEIFHI